MSQNITSSLPRLSWRKRNEPNFPAWRSRKRGSRQTNEPKRTRRAALTGLPYEIASAAETQDVGDNANLADEAAQYIRQQLDAFDTFDGFLEHLATAIGTNLAVGELVWERFELVGTVNVPSRRLIMDHEVPGQVNVITEQNRQGIPAEPPKFVVHTPRSTSGHPFTRSIFRAQAYLYLMKWLSTADWAAYCELFGMPVRVGKYRSNTTDVEKRELARMMENLGSRAWALFSEAVSVEFVETPQRSTAPYKELIEHCDRLQTKVWLGGHLPSDTTGGTGTFAAASVQDQVRHDLRDDAADELERSHKLEPALTLESRRPWYDDLLGR